VLWALIQLKKSDLLQSFLAMTTPSPPYMRVHLFAIHQDIYLTGTWGTPVKRTIFDLKAKKKFTRFEWSDDQGVVEINTDDPDIEKVNRDRDYPSLQINVPDTEATEDDRSSYVSDMKIYHRFIVTVVDPEGMKIWKFDSNTPGSQHVVSARGQ